MATCRRGIRPISRCHVCSIWCERAVSAPLHGGQGRPVAFARLPIRLEARAPPRAPARRRMSARCCGSSPGASRPPSTMAACAAPRSDGRPRAPHRPRRPAGNRLPPPHPRRRATGERVADVEPRRGSTGVPAAAAVSVGSPPPTITTVPAAPARTRVVIPSERLCTARTARRDKLRRLRPAPPRRPAPIRTRAGATSRTSASTCRPSGITDGPRSAAATPAADGRGGRRWGRRRGDRGAGQSPVRRRGRRRCAGLGSRSCRTPAYHLHRRRRPGRRPAPHRHLHDARHYAYGVRRPDRDPQGQPQQVRGRPRDRADRLDRTLFTSTQYPADYGFIENTLGLDGDPLDALVILQGDPLFPGCSSVPCDRMFG